MSSTTAADKGMIRVMAMVLGALVLFTLFCMLMARILGIGGEGEPSQIMRNALIERIEPVGQVRTSKDDLPATQTAAAGSEGGEQVASAKSGEELVQGACASCHEAGVAGAPKTGDDAEWEKRREAGLEALVASVVNGKGSMPAKGGSSYSDEEIKLAVQTLAGFEVKDESGGKDKAADAGKSEGGEKGESADAGKQGDGEQTAEMSAEDDGGDQQSADGEAAGGDVDLVALIGSGDEPDGMSDSVKSAVDGVCTGCHMSGVGNAPKLGDKEAWTPRAETGLAALTKSVNNGKASMPAKGGSQLSEEEIAVAIQYLMAKPGS